MKELTQSVVSLSLYDPPSRTLSRVEAEVRKWWRQGWQFVKAEPDHLMESVRLHFERNPEDYV